MIKERRLLVCVAVLIGFGLPADGQTRAECERAYTPQRGQEGKDVIWQPIEDSMVGRMLELAKVTAADTVYDLGSGDGKIVIAAAKQFGAKGVGVEYDAGLVEHSRCLAAAEGVADRVTFLQGDLFETDFGDATVVTLYLTPQLNLRLMSKLRALKPGTRIVSYAFTIGDWEPDDHIDSFGDGSAYLWIIPPRVAGTWTFRAAAGRDDFEVRLEQTSQRLRGAEDAAVLGPVRGDEIAFALIRGAQHVRAVGTVTGDRIAATVIRGDTPAPYDGTRH